MENRINNSGGFESPKRKSLDLKSLYNSRVSSVGRGKKKASEENPLRNDKKRKIKSGKEVSLSCLDSDAKKRKECINDLEPDQDSSKPSDAGNKLFNGILFSLGENGNPFNIPKRPRGLVGRKRLKNGNLSESLKLSNSVDLVGSSKIDTRITINPDDPIVKLVPLSTVNDDSLNSKFTSDNSYSELKSKKKLELKSVGPSSGSNSKEKRKVISDEKEDHLVKSNGDTSSKNWQSICRKEKDVLIGGDGGKALTVEYKPSSGSSESDSHFVSLIDDEDEENLEQNAARMLSSRFDPNYAGFSSMTNGFSSPVSLARDSFSLQDNSFGTMESASTDDKSRALRPRSEDKGKGVPRKRRHFYEVVPDELETCWLLNRKIKVFWPLDESWYYGIVNDYHPECKLYHIKYDDRDEEWIDLHEEKFKLLLLPSEVPGRRETKTSTGKKNVDKEKSVPLQNVDGDFENYLDSEPIASWLARSSHQVKSLPKLLGKRSSSQVHLPLGYQSSSEETNKYNDRLADTEISLNEAKHKSTSVHKLLDRKKRDRSRVLLRAGFPLSHEKRNSIKDFSRVKRTRSDSKCESTSPGKTLVCESLDQCLIEASCSSLKTQTVVYVRRKHRKQYKSYSSLFAPVKSRNGSPGTVIVDPVAVDPVTVTLNGTEDDESYYGCPESDERTWLIDDLRLNVVLMISQGTRVHICVPLLPFLEHLHGMWGFSLFHNLLMLRHGLIVATSPAVVLEMLFMKSDIGLRFLLFEGCLIQALAIVFLILIEFRHSDELWNGDMRLPVTLIKFRLSGDGDICKKYSFAFYSQSRLQSLKWLYLDSKLMQHCRLMNQLPISECTSDKIMELERGNSRKSKPHADFKFSSLELQEYAYSKPCAISEDITAEENNQTDNANTHACRSLFGCDEDSGRQVILPRNFVEKVGSSENLQMRNVDGAVCSFKVYKENEPEIISQLPLSELNKETHEQSMIPSFSSLPAAITSPSSNSGFDPRTSHTTVGVPCFDQVDLPFTGRREMPILTPNGSNINDVFVHRPNLICSTSLWKPSRSSSSSLPLESLSPLMPDGKTNFVGNGFSNGPRKPRTQVQYTLPFAGYDLNSKQKMENHRAPHYKRIRRSQRRMPVSSKGNPKNLELLACDANILVTNADKGWRESGVRVFLEVEDRNEWRLAVKLSGITKYSYKVKHIFQPGSTNRFSHAMMWRGGNDWVLEFPDRGQWMLFKEMHEECYNRNIRAASVKHIPIPGVWLVEERNDYGTETPFVRNPLNYFLQVQNDVEMAMDPSRVLYDLDSDDEQWLMENKISTAKHGCEEISDEFMEKVMDTFEKVSYVQRRGNFTDAEVEDFVTGIGHLEAAKVVYKYWLQKRERMGLPLIRHLQPPIWERYQQQLKEWELSVARGNDSSVTPCEKPPVSAFYMKPRGLDVPNKGSKQRSQRRFSVSGHHHTTSGDQDSHYAFGRRSNGHAFGDEKMLYASSVHESTDFPVRVFSPRDNAYCSLMANVSEWNCDPKLSKYTNMKLGSHLSPNNQQIMSNKHKTVINRNGVQLWNADLPELSSQRVCYFRGAHRQGAEQLDGLDLHVFQSRDASRAARHALKMAKLKRERAQRLFSNAEFAIHKAVIALMTAEAIKTADENSDVNN